jgi:hypothetical protein
MQVANRHSDKEREVIGNTRLIDPVIYMICERAESEFGQDFIEVVAEEILFTQCGLTRKQIMEFMLDTFIKEHLARHLKILHNDKIDSAILALKPLSESTSADYFMAFMDIQRGAAGTRLEGACKSLENLLFAAASVQPQQACQCIVDFFSRLGDQYGLFLLVQKTSRYIKFLSSEEMKSLEG